VRRLAGLLLCFLLLAVPVWAAVPTLGSNNHTISSTSNQTIVLTNVDAGAALVVFVVSSGSNTRTYTISDDSTNNYTTVETGSGCGVTRCAMVWADYSAASSASLTITIDQSATHQAYHIFAAELVCATTCAADTASSLLAGAGAQTWYASADSTVIDTTTDVFLIAACGLSANHQTLTVKSGWTEFNEPTPSGLVAAQYRDSAGALTDERGELSNSSAVNAISACAIISVKEVAAAGSTPRLTLVGVGPPW
jgi:hypothetical protein